MNSPLTTTSVAAPKLVALEYHFDAVTPPDGTIAVYRPDRSVIVVKKVEQQVAPPPSRTRTVTPRTAAPPAPRTVPLMRYPGGSAPAMLETSEVALTSAPAEKLVPAGYQVLRYGASGGAWKNSRYVPAGTVIRNAPLASACPDRVEPHVLHDVRCAKTRAPGTAAPPACAVTRPEM